MNQEYFQTSDWYGATTLVERMASLPESQHQKQTIKNNTESAKTRLEKWRNQPPFASKNYFNQRLAMDGITEQELLFLLSESKTTFQERHPETPIWLATLTEAFLTDTSNSKELNLLKDLKLDEIEGFLAVIEPLIAQGYTKLSQEIEVLNQIQSEKIFEPEAVKEMLLTNLTEQLLEIIARTLVLELNVARLQELLKGDTSQERFRSFVERLRQQNVAISLLQEYPVLARQVIIYIERWVTFSIEFLQHLCSDWQLIQEKFSPQQKPGLLIALNDSAGDKHRERRSVMIAEFSSGLKLVYKPRSLAVDIHFQELLTWLNERGNHLPLRIPKVIDRNHYGWAEFITHESCQTPAEIKRFYERQGGYLALLYVTQSSDFHSENLIAHGEHPILIDLESLFHPLPGKLNASQAEYVADEKMAYSVLKIGLLPELLWGNDKSEGVDVSGFGTTEGQLTPHKLPYWQKSGTDEMQLQRKQMKMTRDLNLPTLKGQDVKLLDYTEEIIAGFTNVYNLFIKHRDELLSPTSPLAAFAEDEIRVILRNTSSYEMMLNESFHPDLLRDALERDCFFDRLWLQTQYQPYLNKVIAVERQDLLQGDIPLFTTYPNSRDLFSSSGKAIKDFLSESSIDLVYRCIQRLSEADLEQQLWFIRASLATTSTDIEHMQWLDYSLTKPIKIASKKKILESARAIGDRLEWLALRGTNNVSWIGLNLVKEHQWALEPVGLDLYDGIPGITLFLAYLGDVTREQRYTTLAQAALSTMQRKVQQNQSYFKSVGGFDGWGGVIYTLTHLSILWDRPDLLTEAEQIVSHLPKLIEQDRKFDILSGTAGCLGSLLALYRSKPNENTLAVAIKCGEQLIKHAQPMKRGVGWSANILKGQPLAGYSHGTAGIAWALLELASLTGEKRFQETALQAIEYERSLFCSEVNNWLDLRDLADTVLTTNEPESIPQMCAWCHGASGIGLGRLGILHHLDNAEVRSEIDAALEKTMVEGFGSNHSLCHGDLGNLELLLQASLNLEDSQWKSQVDRLTTIILNSIQQHGWLCGVPLKIEHPGLMTGLAGIGYGLLRSIVPKQIPSLLILEPPKLNDVGSIHDSGKVIAPVV